MSRRPDNPPNPPRRLTPEQVGELRSALHSIRDTLPGNLPPGMVEGHVYDLHKRRMEKEVQLGRELKARKVGDLYIRHDPPLKAQHPPHRNTPLQQKDDYSWVWPLLGFMLTALVLYLIYMGAIKIK